MLADMIMQLNGGKIFKAAIKKKDAKDKAEAEAKAKAEAEAAAKVAAIKKAKEDARA